MENVFLKQDVIKQYRINEKDTGSVEVQTALLTARIRLLTEHLKIHKKDKASRRGLLKLVGKRKSFLRYLKKKNIEKYRNLIESLKIRK